ncbi:2Fe-2S ferredoxin [Pseudomonas sp. JAI111]|uniref:2Fe-2S iron-sulfur cluster-binding protein n=1 Tax=Pseudomonas sp. JAI111 TaxID=2735913 RepID=UPI0021698707|nr:2Fe-2S iron-sulfur cluster-binding protein [Pseudomonas sp. JAI111]MCS3835698.1 2Fe-2S ferredoxin [Pseudomonas sp. JAI111]
MTQITFVEHGGNRIEAQAQPGDSVMKVALAYGLGGITAECGGCLSCATCHVYVDEGWLERIPAATDDERALIECAVDAGPSSRLSCQLIVAEGLDGLVVHLPESQY